MERLFTLTFLEKLITDRKKIRKNRSKRNLTDQNSSLATMRIINALVLTLLLLFFISVLPNIPY